MCLPFEATTETVEWEQWIRHNGVARCKLQSSMVLMSDAPSKSEALCHSIPGNVFNSSPTMTP
jgi:hypothetical protein